MKNLIFCLYCVLNACFYVTPASHSHSYHSGYESSDLRVESAEATCEWNSFVGEAYWKFDAEVYSPYWIHTVDALMTNSPEYSDITIRLHDMGAGHWGDNAWIAIPCAAAYDVEFIAYDENGNIATRWDLW